MQYLLDTVSFVKALQGTLPSRLRRRLEKQDSELLISIVTPWEIALEPDLNQYLTGALVEQKISQLGARLLPIKLNHISVVSRLAWHHRDPFDRMIIAQALEEQCALVSNDHRFPLYRSSGLRVLWD